MSVDLTNCDREPIHLLGHVQSFGCLISLTPDWMVNRASQNVKDFLGVEAGELVGRPLRDHLPEDAVHHIRGAIQTLSTVDSIARLFDLELIEGDPARFNVALHRSNRSTIVEIERAASSEDRVDSLAQVRSAIDHLNACENVDRLCATAVRFVRLFTGFDRVMVYKFASDGTGEVVAEAARAGIDSFMGLRYPASDIPRQARELYKRSLIRIISDVNDNVSPILPELDADSDKVDLSLSTLRAVSPIHLEYLRNMGVAASMSISIIRDGKLWGLFACHHYEPRVLDYRVRCSSELFGQMFGFVLSHFENRERHADAESARTLHDRLMRQFANGADVVRDIDLIVDGLGELIDFDGAASWIDGNFRSVGTTPSEDEVMGIVRFLNTTASGQVYASSCLQKVHPPAADYSSRAAGILALPVSRSPRDYIMLFRSEVTKKVHWAGNPEKPVELGPNGVRLTPRKSFESWQQLLEGHSEDWSASELEVAETIRVSLLEVVLRMSDAANEERTRANEKQELLIAELNHRVRNVLNLIRGLVEQSKADAVGVAEFTANVTDRIQALARAHDQITRNNWSAASLHELIDTEMKAYLGEKSSRVILHGPDAIVQPDAFTTLALVFHELTSNSAKYGALADSRGRIDITCKPGQDGAMSVTWVESDGPAVKPPLRRGFGSTIIERSIPYELGGEAEISYPLSGVRARLLIPSPHIAELVEEETADQAAVTAQAPETAGPQTLSGTILLVEDNMIIALDSEKFLADLGADKVLTASSVGEALRFIESEDVACAMLDLNLGTETSLPVAKVLKERGIPFAFATGYGDTAQLLEDYPEVEVLTKPYEKAMVAEVVGGLLR